MFTINSIVDLKKNKLELEPGMEFNCVEGDSGSAYKIIFNFKQCINFENISGILTILMPDGMTEYTDSIVFEDQKTAYYKLKDELLSQVGKVQVSLTLMDDSRFTVYTNFIINVKKKLSSYPVDIDPSDPMYLLLQSLLYEVRNLETSVNNAEMIRIENEIFRVDNEDARIAAEQLREAAENIRIDNENDRNSEWILLKEEIDYSLSQIRQGKDATINGYNAIEIIGGMGINLTQESNIVTINGDSFTWKSM